MESTTNTYDDPLNDIKYCSYLGPNVYYGVSSYVWGLANRTDYILYNVMQTNSNIPLVVYAEQSSQTVSVQINNFMPGINLPAFMPPSTCTTTKLEPEDAKKMRDDDVRKLNLDGLRYFMKILRSTFI